MFTLLKPIWRGVELLKTFWNPRKESRTATFFFLASSAIFGWFAGGVAVLLFNRYFRSHFYSHPESWIAVLVILCAIDGYVFILKRVVK
jgi:hypothetical protein